MSDLIDTIGRLVDPSAYEIYPFDKRNTSGRIEVARQKSVMIIHQVMSNQMQAKTILGGIGKAFGPANENEESE